MGSDGNARRYGQNIATMVSNHHGRKWKQYFANHKVPLPT